MQGGRPWWYDMVLGSLRCSRIFALSGGWLGSCLEARSSWWMGGLRLGSEVSAFGEIEAFSRVGDRQDV